MTPEQLKASILQRAMEGKLVPQDPNDEPASELLKRIKDEKEKLISEGKVKRDKKETEFFCGDDGKPYEKLADGTVKKVEVPYEIPESWEWVRLGNIGYWGSGATPSKSNLKYYEPQAVPWLLTGDLTDGYITHIPNKISELALEKTSVRLNPTGSVLIAMYGATIGKLGILTFPATTNQACCACNTLFHVEKLFLFYFLMSARKNFTARAEGGAQPNISKEKIINTLFPLPPLAEQKRIVTQIERALKQVEIYAENYHKLQELDRAFPDKLKKSILQYAMQGKLVAQNPNDEPVEILLEKIRAEKQKLFEEGKLKKKDLTEMVVIKGDDNSHYGNKEERTSSAIPNIPNSWCYIKLGDLVLFNIGKTPPRSEPTFWGNDISWVSISDMPIRGHITKTKEGLSHSAINQKNIKIAPVGTLLMSFKLSIGKVAVLEIPASHNEAIISIFPYIDEKHIIRNYLMTCLPLISTAGNSKDAIKGKTLNSTSISELLIPISNYREMNDIVSKIDLLFQKVSRLSE
ncbi:TPA: restriction endonuclease subunit S [Streptococcus suis]|uniref:restriction endonuclease subunit S n=5 Tax=Streptococcus suis TaxID=1307 RepID=UPI00155352B4|nr:restriction endonuclease subunit S [Streptococcus suis]MBS8089875.1 restriction endonuclease subunit S [Streptococcus suis]MCB2853455.1 restriction endonuclease subunit S [Streptococcus suis]MCB2865717.1 restriction endonuclease subunit S [Streptococcus suis]MCB2876126.1 restriction endonuclease subunit S [Streptococcus suis]MCB2904572.1 restriction endonuclease subunit S [Streptococcus suis]